MNLSRNARLAEKTLLMEPAHGIPTWMLNLMDIPLMEQFAGYPENAYASDPESVYLDFQKRIGA